MSSSQSSRVRAWPQTQTVYFSGKNLCRKKKKKRDVNTGHVRTLYLRLISFFYRREQHAPVAVSGVVGSKLGLKERSSEKGRGGARAVGPERFLEGECDSDWKFVFWLMQIYLF